MILDQLSRGIEAILNSSSLFLYAPGILLILGTLQFKFQTLLTFILTIGLYNWYVVTDKGTDLDKTGITILIVISGFLFSAGKNKSKKEIFSIIGAFTLGIAAAGLWVSSKNTSITAQKLLFQDSNLDALIPQIAFSFGISLPLIPISLILGKKILKSARKQKTMTAISGLLLSLLAFITLIFL